MHKENTMTSNLSLCVYYFCFFSNYTKIKVEGKLRRTCDMYRHFPPHPHCLVCTLKFTRNEKNVQIAKSCPINSA